MDRPSNEHTFSRADVDRLVAALHRENDIVFEMESEAYRTYFIKTAPSRVVSNNMLERIRQVTGAPMRLLGHSGNIDKKLVEYGGCVFIGYVTKEA